MASVWIRFILRPISNKFKGADAFFTRILAWGLKKQVLGTATDKFIEILLKGMDWFFYLTPDGNFRRHLENFSGRYYFKTADKAETIGISATFSDGDMHVHSGAIDNWDVMLTFKDGTAFRNFIFFEDKDILDRVRSNDIEVDGNLNYIYKFRFMCRDFSRRLDLEATGPIVYDRQTVRHFLAAEEREACHPVRKLILGFIASLAEVVFMFTLPVGLMVIWFYKSFGLQLFLAAGIAGIVLMIVKHFLKVYMPQLDGLRKADKSTRSAIDALEERIDRYEVWKTYPLIGMFFGMLPGLIWLGYSIFVAHQISLTSLVLIAIPSLVWTGLKVVDLCREFWYFFRVSRLSDWFDRDLERKEKLSMSLERGIPISLKDVDLLSQVELRQVARRNARIQKVSSHPEWHSIFVSLKALEFLESLPNEQYTQKNAVRVAIRKVIDSLQLNPHPIEALAKSKSKNMFVIISGNYEIIYVVDSGKQRVNVTDIHDIRQKEVPHAS